MKLFKLFTITVAFALAMVACASNVKEVTALKLVSGVHVVNVTNPAPRLNLMAVINTDITCVGTTQPAGYQESLIAQQWVLANAHTGSLYWDSNQVFRIAGQDIPYSGTNYWAGTGSDMVLCQLSRPAPASCVTPFIFPPNYTNYLPNHSPVGMQCFWLHKSAGRTDNVKIIYAGSSRGYDYLTCFNNASTAGTNGDSGSPCFTSVNGQLVLLFATTAPGPVGGPLTDKKCFDFITKTIPPDQLKFLNLSNYQNLANL